MPLINLQTDLKSLPFGRDRREGGSSKQPYITQDIPEGLNYDDMPGRGIGDQFFVPTGFLKPRETIRDVSRLAQMFADDKSPRGLLFIAEQNLLSRTSVKTQAGGTGYGGTKTQQVLGGGSLPDSALLDPSIEIPESPAELEALIDSTYGQGFNELNLGGGGGINQGIYTPASTLLGATGVGFGGHPNFLGLDPTSNDDGGLFPGTGITTYYGVAKGQREADSDKQNRLQKLYEFHLNTGFPNTNINVYSYSGGPGSIIGIGKTHLLFSDQGTGERSPNYTEIKAGTYLTDRPNKKTIGSFINPLVSGAFAAYIADGGDGGIAEAFEGGLTGSITSDGGYTWNLTNVYPSVYKVSGSLTPKGNINTYLTPTDKFTLRKFDETTKKSVAVISSYIPASEAEPGQSTYDVNGVIRPNASSVYSSSIDGPSNLRTARNGNEAVSTDGQFPTQNFVTSVNSFDDDEKLKANTDVLYDGESTLGGFRSLTYDQQQLVNKENVSKGQPIDFPQDFRKELYTYPSTGSSAEKNNRSTILSLSPDYQTKNIDRRLNMGQPGKSNTGTEQGFIKNVWDYGLDATQLEALDKITAMPMYTSTGPRSELAINDLVKFRIAAINNDGANREAVYMHFRAHLDSFSDSYNASWNEVNYVGRGDSLYNYGGFGRDISLSFTCFAQSKAELIPMHKKLNYLASTLAPDYTQAGFMRGNLVRLTVGGYLYEQPGFITSLTYDVPQESPWEIAINAEGGVDSSVKELPHMIKVSGFSFTPIHTFLPQKPNQANNPSSRFIALANAVDSSGNYADAYREYNATGDGDNNNGNNIPGEGTGE